MSYLLDTNVVSEGRKPSGHPGVRAWLRSVNGEDLYLSVLVVGEIGIGIERLRRRDPGQAMVYEEWLSQLEREYADRVLPITPPVAKQWAKLNVPDLLPAIDGLLAATAIVYGLTLVTRNSTHFIRTGARLLNPFDSLHS